MTLAFELIGVSQYVCRQNIAQIKSKNSDLDGSTR